MKNFTFILLVFLTPCPNVQAQNIWLRDSTNAISVEILKPFFADSDIKFFSTAIYLSGKFRFSEKITFSIIVPMANGKVESFGFENSEFALGNLYAGIEFKKSNNLWFEVGIHAPTSPDDKFLAQFIGLLSDFNRIESFLSDYLILPLMVNYSQTEETFYYRFRGGPKFIINTGDNLFFNDEAEIMLDYSGQVGYSSTTLSAILGLTGNYQLTEDLSFNDASTHEFGIALFVLAGNAVPVVSIRIPLDDDLNDFLDLTVGLGVTFNLQ